MGTELQKDWAMDFSQIKEHLHILRDRYLKIRGSL